MTNELWVFDAGITNYPDARRLQQTIARLRRSSLDNDVLILTEHTPTITLGRSASPSNLLASTDSLKQLGVEVFESDRGGDVTFHGPGQVVGYPIIDLHNDLHCGNVHQYLRSLEEVIIVAIRSFGLEGGRVPGLTGVWIDPDEASGRKLAAMGIKVSHWITQHGFALNTNIDLEYFDLIVACGIADRGVTSMAHELGHNVDASKVSNALCLSMQQVFNYSLVRWVTLEELSD